MLLLLLLLSRFSRVRLCVTPKDGSPLGSSVSGILQARILDWVAISFSNAWKWKWSYSVVSDSQRPYGLQPTRLLCPWDFPGKSTGAGCLCEFPIHLFLAEWPTTSNLTSPSLSLWPVKWSQNSSCFEELSSSWGHRYEMLKQITQNKQSLNIRYNHYCC